MLKKIFSLFSGDTNPLQATADKENQSPGGSDNQNCKSRSQISTGVKIEFRTRDKSTCSKAPSEIEATHQKGTCFLDEDNESQYRSPHHRNFLMDMTIFQSPNSSAGSILRPHSAKSQLPNRSNSPFADGRKSETPKPEKTVGPYKLYKKLHCNNNNSVQVWTALHHHDNYPIMQKHLPFVAKVFDLKRMTQIQKTFAKNEWQLHMLLSDTREQKKYTEIEGVLPLAYLYDSPEESYKMMVFPNCYQGDLREFLKRNKDKRIPESVIRKFMLGVREALWQMRLQEIMHRDIKPENILILNNRCFLADFGIAIKDYLSGIKHESVKLGTQAYSPPEFLGILDMKELRQFFCHSDYWSFGVVLFEMTFGYCPFHGLDEETLKVTMKKMPELIEELSEKFEISDCLKDLLTGMLRFVPGDRYSFYAWANHSWWRTTDRKMCQY